MSTETTLPIIFLKTPNQSKFIQFIWIYPAYKSIGCWRDTSNRAIPTLEGTSDLLDGNYGTRTNAIEKCLNATLSFGYDLFAVQHGGWCAGSYKSTNYQKYGSSSDCATDGEGGPWANQVYEITYGNYYLNRNTWCNYC